MVVLLPLSLQRALAFATASTAFRCQQLTPQLGQLGFQRTQMVCSRLVLLGTSHLEKYNGFEYQAQSVVATRLLQTRFLLSFQRQT